MTDQAPSKPLDPTLLAEAVRRAKLAKVPVEVVLPFLLDEVERQPFKVEYVDLPHLNIGEVERIGTQKVLRLNWKHPFVQFMWGDDSGEVGDELDETSGVTVTANMTYEQRCQVEVMLFIMLDFTDLAPDRRIAMQQFWGDVSKRLYSAVPVLESILDDDFAGGLRGYRGRG